MYELEAIPEKEARDYAELIGARFFYTSAKNDFGIDDLFKYIAQKYINPNFTDFDSTEGGSNLKLGSKNGNSNKGCCKS